MQKTRHQFFPVNKKIPEHLELVIKVFSEHADKINSHEHTLNSNTVLEILRKDLEDVGFSVETSKKMSGKIRVPVLFGENGRIIKAFDVDGYHEEFKTVLEVEAGRGVTNYQFLKDFFSACIMVDVDYCVIAIRDIYTTGKKERTTSKDFETVKDFFDSMYASGRIKIPLHGLLIIGY
jgi:hypothetical protein